MTLVRGGRWKGEGGRGKEGGAGVEVGVGAEDGEEGVRRGGSEVCVEQKGECGGMGGRGFRRVGLGVGGRVLGEGGTTEGERQGGGEGRRVDPGGRRRTSGRAWWYGAQCAAALT